MNEPPRVYLVEDDAAVLRSLEALLRMFHYDVRSYPTAREFLRDIPHASPGCVLTDLNMPEINGRELQQILRRSGSRLSVVMLTGAADPESIAGVMADGATALLEKPYHTDELFDAIDRALAESRERGEE